MALHAMQVDAYEQWYATPRGRWIGAREITLLERMLRMRRDDAVLDVGCGTGYFTRALARATDGAVAGVDVDAGRIARARQIGPESIRYALADACALPYADRSFNVVTSLTALGFVEDERKAVDEMVRVARRRIAIGLLNRNSRLWREKTRPGSGGHYGSTRWHTADEARALLEGLPLRDVRVGTAIHFPGGSLLARLAEHLIPARCLTGAFLLLTADVAAAATAQHDTSPARTAQ